MMRIESSTEMHTHYIEELYKKTNLLIERMSDMKVSIGIAEHAIELQSVNMEKLINKCATISEMIDKLNLDTYRRFQPIEFVRELLTSPKSLLIFMGFVFLVDLAIGVHDLAKYFLR